VVCTSVIPATQEMERKENGGLRPIWVKAWDPVKNKRPGEGCVSSGKQRGWVQSPVLKKKKPGTSGSHL
jgi:hypothetical protein